MVLGELGELRKIVGDASFRGVPHFITPVDKPRVRYAVTDCSVYADTMEGEYFTDNDSPIGMDSLEIVSADEDFTVEFLQEDHFQIPLIRACREFARRRGADYVEVEGTDDLVIGSGVMTSLRVYPILYRKKIKE